MANRDSAVVSDPGRAATVMIARPFSVFGSARAPTITIDGLETYDLGPGEHVAMAVAPGERIVGMKIWDFVTRRATVKIQTEAGRTGPVGRVKPKAGTRALGGRPAPMATPPEKRGAPRAASD